MAAACQDAARPTLSSPTHRGRTLEGRRHPGILTARQTLLGHHGGVAPWKREREEAGRDERCSDLREREGGGQESVVAWEQRSWGVRLGLKCLHMFYIIVDPTRFLVIEGTDP